VGDEHGSQNVCISVEMRQVMSRLGFVMAQDKSSVKSVYGPRAAW
jgi:hypothetical protein